MKRYLFSLLCILAAVSCMNEKADRPVGEQEIQFTGYFLTDDVTKTVLENGRNVYWLPGDRISVSGAQDAFVASAEEKTEITSFSGTAALSEVYYAIYPYEVVTRWTGNSAIVNVPAEQEAVKGTFADDLNISVAMTTSADLSLAFQNVLGYMKFTVGQGSGAIKSLEVKTNGGESISGTAFVSFDPGTGYGLLESVAQSSTVTLSSDSAWEAGDYYVAMIPGKYTSGLTLTFTDDQGRTAVKTVEKELVLGEGVVQDVGVVSGLIFDGGDTPPPADDEYINFLDHNTETLCILNWDTDGDNRLSYAEAAAVESVGTVFKGSTILSFDEFKYFTSVKKLEDNAFYECRQLRKLTLPESVEEIGRYALCMLDAISELVIPAAVKTMAELSMTANPSVEKIVVAEGNTVYDSRNNCNALIHTETNRLLAGCKNTVIPDDVLIIAQNAFYRARIENLVIPDMVHTLERFAFGECQNLKTTYVGNGIKTWNSNAFNKCTGDFVVNSNIPDYSSATNAWLYSPFYGCEMSSVTFGPDVTSIGECAFPGCVKLSKINIPETVQKLGRNIFLRGVPADELFVNCREIGYYAFEGDEVANLTIGDNVEVIGEGAFKGGRYKKLTIGDNVKTINKVAFASVVADDIVWGTKIESLGTGAFQMATIPSAYLPSVKSLGNQAFWSCKNIQSAVLSDALETIPYEAFADCATLKEVTFPKSLKSFGGEAFRGAGLLSIILPEGLKDIAGGVFDQCTSCQTAQIPSTVQTIEVNAFRGCTGELTVCCPLPSKSDLFARAAFSKIVLTDAVTSIPESAFFRCAALEEIVLPESLKEIGYMAFWECTSLKNIALPSSLTTIGQKAFLGCTALESIVIPEKVTVLDHEVFRECTSLSEVALPESLTEIRSYAFSWSGLKEITLPQNVTYLGYYSFGSTYMTAMYCLPEVPPAIQENFLGFATVPNIYVPALSVNNYKTSSAWKSYASSIFAGDF